MLKSILDTLFPKYCLLCGKLGYSLCPYCKKKLRPSLPECYKCRRLSAIYQTHSKCKTKYSLDSVFWGWQYNGDSSKLIKVFKYKGAENLSRDISEMFSKRILETEFLNKFKTPLFIPIPLHTTKFKERGFNQSELVAQNLSQILGIPSNKDLLSRQYKGTAQAHKDLHKRKNLIEDIFVFKSKNYNKEEIILVDDVVTTGATIERACRSIKLVNPNTKVSAICLLRGKPHYSLASASSISRSTS